MFAQTEPTPDSYRPDATDPDVQACTRARARLEARREQLEHDRAPEALHELRRIDEALRWIAAGLYGRCSICCGTLDVSQIESDPADKTCHQCKRATVSARRRRAQSWCQTAVTPPAPAEPSHAVLSLHDGAEALNRQFERTARVARVDG